MSAQAPAPAVPIAPPALAQPTTLAGLQAQGAELRVQLAGLQAQWDGLKSQLDNMLQNNPARPGVQQKWADVGVQRAQVQGDIARIDAQIAQLTGRQGGFPGTRPPSAPPFGRPFDANKALPVAAILLVVMVFPISVAWARRIARGTPRTAPVPSDHTARLERMEQAIDAVAIEVERIAEGQRFVTRIPAGRPEGASRAAGAESPAQSAPGAQPLRALGAGPAELYRVPEREQVREGVITPR